MEPYAAEKVIYEGELMVGWWKEDIFHLEFPKHQVIIRFTDEQWVEMRQELPELLQCWE